MSEREIEIFVSNGLAGCTRRWVIKVAAEDCDPDSLEEIARDEVFNRLEWGWQFIDDDSPLESKEP